MNDEPELVELVELVELGTASDVTRGVIGMPYDSEHGPGYALGT